MNKRTLAVQAIYLAVGGLAVLDKFSRGTIDTAAHTAAHAAIMRQVMALMRWAHKFGPDEHVQRAARFLRERVPLMLTVRAPPAGNLIMRWQCFGFASNTALCFAAGRAQGPPEHRLQYDLRMLGHGRQAEPAWPCGRL